MDSNLDARAAALASYLVGELIKRGAIKPAKPEDELIACVTEMISENFEIAAKIEDEAATMAENLGRQDSRVDVGTLRSKIRARLAEKKNFPL
jgi:hypothetical protein